LRSSFLGVVFLEVARAVTIPAVKVNKRFKLPGRV
jgi:hypothetical protein